MSEWFKKWFSSDEYLSVYSHRNENDAQNIIKLILNNYPIKNNLEILDAACGAGRHSIVLSNLGHNVTAFDLSKSLLKIAYQDAEQAGSHVRFICSDIREISFRSSFDLVLNMFTSFGYFDTDEENFLFYRNIIKSLKPKGVIVLDYFNSDYLINNLVPYSTRRIAGKIIEESRRIENDKVIKDILIKHDNIVHQFHEAVKLYSLESLEYHFNKLGFKIQSKYGDYMGGKFHKSSSKRLILFLTK